MTENAERHLLEHELEERLDALLFASPSHRSISRLAVRLESLPRIKQDRVLHWAGVAAQTYAEIGYLIASLAPEALEKLGDEGFETWVLAGLDAYDKDGLRPAMDRLRDIAGFRAAAEGARPAVFEDVAVRLGRFVQGLSGRPLVLREAVMAWTDTETIFLPRSVGRLPDIEANRRLYKATVVMLWAQTRYGTFAADLPEALARWPERSRAVAWLSLLEAVRLEACVRRDLPGLGAELAALRGDWPAAVAPMVARLSAAEATIGDSLACLEHCMATAAEPPQLFQGGTIDPEAALRVRTERIARETRILRKALAALRGTSGHPGEEEPTLTADLAPDGKSLEFRIEGDLVTVPPEAQAAAQSLLQDLGELPPDVLTPAGPGDWQPTDRRDVGTTLAVERAGALRYDEWDYHRRAYRQDWCHLQEYELHGGDAGYVAEVRLRRAPLIAQIRRRFEALLGEDRIIGRQPDGDDIDVDALVEAVADRRGGREPSARLFARRMRNQRSLAAMFMVDMSGSTKGWVNDAEREALVMLCEALEMLGDRYAIYGFSGWTRTRCDIYRIKSFDDAYDAAVQARIAAIEAKDYTRMGVAIRHLAGLLSGQQARHKLLVTLSDGRPDDFGDEYRGHYGVEDTRRALQEAHQKGIRSYCITIDRQGADYLKHMYGPANYAVVAEVDRLPFKLAEIYRRLTAA